MEARGTGAFEARVTGSFEPLDWESNLSSGRGTLSTAEPSVQAHSFDWLEMVYFPLYSHVSRLGGLAQLSPSIIKALHRPHVVAHAYSPGPPEAGGLKV